MRYVIERIKVDLIRASLAVLLAAFAVISFLATTVIPLQKRRLASSSGKLTQP
jgi:hypothetical protein